MRLMVFSVVCWDEGGLKRCFRRQNQSNQFLTRLQNSRFPPWCHRGMYESRKTPKAFAPDLLFSDYQVDQGKNTAVLQSNIILVNIIYQIYHKIQQLFHQWIDLYSSEYFTVLKQQSSVYYQTLEYIESKNDVKLLLHHNFMRKTN